MVLMAGMQFTKEIATNYEEVSNFFSRKPVILLCSAAAMGSSATASCESLSRRAASISSEVLPVAQMMKIKPNFCSYSRLRVASESIVVCDALATPDCS